MMSQRGSGRLGCLVVILLLGTFFFSSYKIGPVLLYKVNFQDDLERIVSRAGAENWSDRAIIEHILAAGRVETFELTPDDIEIQRASRFEQAGRLRVRVIYRRPVELPGYVYIMHFKSESEGLIGRL